MGGERRGPRPTLRRALVGALLAQTLGCIVPFADGEAPGYDPALPDRDLYHWPVGRTVVVFADSTAVPAAIDLREVVALAAEGWTDELYYRELRIVTTTDVRDADVLVRVAAAPRRVGTAGCAPPADGAAGTTFFCRARLPEPAQDTTLTLPLEGSAPGRVKVEIAIDPTLAPTPLALSGLVAHELGHALGIGAHSTSAEDVMFAAPRVARPSARDGATLRWVVHQRADLRL